MLTTGVLPEETTDPTMQIVMLVLTLAGAGIAAWGLVSAYMGTRSQTSAANERIETRTRLQAEEKAEHAQIDTSIRNAGDLNKAIFDKYEALYSTQSIVRPTRANLPDLAALEAQRLQLDGVGSTRQGLVVAAVGLVISTAGGVLSLFM